MKVEVKKINFPKVSLYQLGLNRTQRKELARIILDAAKTIFLTVVVSYLFPPLIGFEGKVELAIALKGAAGTLLFLYIGTDLLKEVKR